MASLMIIVSIIIAIVSALLIGIILIQQSKGGGFGIAFGGIGESVFGAHAASHLIKITVTLMIIFGIAVLAMNFMSRHRAASTTLMDRVGSTVLPVQQDQILPVNSVDTVKAALPATDTAK